MKSIKEYRYDLAVAYRIYSGVSKIPPVYPNDKYKLADFCLSSFKKSLGNLKVKMYVLLDGCPPEYEKMFENYFEKSDLEIIRCPNIGNKKTFKKQIDILLQQGDAEYIYFAEDDYFYIDSLVEVWNFIRTGRADFVSPYEHPSCYTDGHVIQNAVTLFGKRRYTTVQHACLTFMTTKANLRKNKRLFLIYPNWFASDFVVWSSITLGFRYFVNLHFLYRPKGNLWENIKVYGTMLFFAWNRFIVNKKYRLYMPIGTIATHLESRFLSPLINWDDYFQNKN
jgi:hypothetical protein